MFLVYVLKSEKDNKLYIGSTNNLSRRILEHNQGNVHSTKNRRPLILVFTEHFPTKAEALKREHYFKSGGKAHQQLKKYLGA